MAEPKRKSLINVTEKDYSKADEVLSIIGAYKSTHRKECPTLLDALVAILNEWQALKD